MEDPIVNPDVQVTAEPPVEPAPDAAERIVALERDLREAERSLRRAQARSEIHRALVGSGAIDVDAVALVVENALPEAPDAAAVARGVEEVRRTRPALFRGAAPSRGPTMNARVDRPRTSLEDAAQHAARRGDRASLMSYLRLRRAV